MDKDKEKDKDKDKEKESADKSPKAGNLWLIKSIFSKGSGGRDGEGDGEANNANPPIAFLSTFANSVVSRCSKILGVSTKELQEQFDTELPNDVKQCSSHARNFLEFCSFKALQVAISRPKYLSDKEFRRLTFDMMVAWEIPGVDSCLVDKDSSPNSKRDVLGEDVGSLFYSNSTRMAVQVDDEKTVGPEAFARMAPACPVIADITTVHNLFDVLTCSSGSRLHFLLYDKYLRGLEKVTKFVQNAGGPQASSNLSLAEEEIIVDIDGTVPTQPVLQHVGMSAWPGRLTLTNYALYFESGVGLYDKAVKYDLATEVKQVIKPELTGPLGARIFDKAVMYKSTLIEEPVYLEFPEFKGCSRRDYWLDICLEILRVHKFTRKYNLKGNQKSEALARAILGIFRFRAVRESFRISSSNYKTLLCFNLAESVPGGDMIMETLSSHLALISPKFGQPDTLGSPNSQRRPVLPAALMTLIRFKIVSSDDVKLDEEPTRQYGSICVGELNPLEDVVKQLKQNTGMAEAAQATVDQVKVEGIDANLAVMKELLLPIIKTHDCLQRLATWDEPFKSLMFVLFSGYLILRDWTKFVLPVFLILLATVMLWRRYIWRRRQLEAMKITAPPNKNPVEQLLILQEAVTQVESLIQNGNVVLLKIRALAFAVAPQATEKLAMLMVLAGVGVMILPGKYMMLLGWMEWCTRNSPLRRESSERGLRRLKEWWTRIPAAPVHLVKPDHNDKKRK
ncbi:uncharacterized protein LOC127244950 [Andrographis paniculata]|uniref:uncharacterized protein LOC127244950 n=1 Tax=Andrographis paniculata TaxID=175694 RepID=UPI0021E78DD0|nr:uncharacterized protein LOC127244950 [Andrographis paniculata]